MAGVGALKDRALGVARTQRDRRPWLDHVVRAYQRYKSTNGDHMAAAITYFSFLAIFPLLLLGISVGGFVLANNPGLVSDLKGVIADNVPGGLGSQLSESVDTLIANRGSIGIVALLGVAYSGLGWIGNLRTGLQVVWSCEPQKENFLKAKLGDLLVLVGLGLGIVVSIALTSGGTAATGALVKVLGLDGVFGMGTLVRVVGILLALAADTLIFMWLFVRLPRRRVRYKTVVRGAVFAAVGYEILKVVGTFYIARIGKSPTYGTFGSVIGLLVWIDLVSRFLLFSAAWTATGQQPAALTDCGDDEPEPGFAVDVDDRPGDGVVVGPAPAGHGRGRPGGRRSRGRGDRRDRRPPLLAPPRGPRLTSAAQAADPARRPGPSRGVPGPTLRRPGADPSGSPGRPAGPGADLGRPGASWGVPRRAEAAGSGAAPEPRAQVRRRRETQAAPMASSTAAPASPPAATGIRGNPSSAAGRGAATGAGAAGVGDGVGDGVGVAGSTGSTSVPTVDSPRGSAKPQSSSRDACTYTGTGCCSARRNVTTRRRPPRCAAPTNVCRARSVNPFFTPIAPG